MKKNIFLTLLLVCSLGVATAQTTLKTAYFTDRMTTRHEFNPALQCEYGYLSIPLLGDFNFGVNSNISIDNFLFPLDNGSVALFTHPEVDTKSFLSNLSDDNLISENLNLSLFSFGFHGFGGFTTFDISLRESLDINLKKSLFEFIANDGSGSSSYSMGGSTIDMSVWTEIALGHSRKINDNLTVGAKLKYLVGAANINFELSKLDFSSSADAVMLDLNAKANVSVVGMDLSGSLTDMAFDSFSLSNGLNSGFGLDLGATYKLDKFNFSLAVTDIGYIKWAASSYDASATINYTGFNDIDFDDTSALDTQIEDLLSPLDDLMDAELSPAEDYYTSLNAKLNIGAEYQVLDYLSVGALSTTTFSSTVVSEFSLISTLRPCKWFSFALSGTASTYGVYWGCAVNICPRWINFFIGTDCMIQSVTPQFIPYGSTNLNLKMGLSIPIGPVKKVN